MTTRKPTIGREFGHGKVVLLGEHAVVYGKPALAAGLSTGLWASVSEGTGHLTVPAWSLAAHVHDGTTVGNAWAALVARLSATNIDARIEGNLPARAGLGSSAALAVALARAISAARGCTPDQAREAATAAETVFHGTPSGIDLAAAWAGGVGRFQRDSGWHPVTLPRPLVLCIGLSGRPHDTRAQVDAVRKLRDRTACAGAIIDTLGSLCGPGVAALADGDLDELGRLFDIAHGLLSALRLSSPELDAMVHLARGAGATGAKLTGAGGGGAVIAVTADRDRQVLECWRNAGFKGFLAQIGAPATLAAPPRLPPPPERTGRIGRGSATAQNTPTFLGTPRSTP